MIFDLFDILFIQNYVLKFNFFYIYLYYIFYKIYLVLAN